MLAGCRGDAFWLNNVVLCRIDGSTIEEKEGSYMDLRVRGPSGEVVDGKNREARLGNIQRSLSHKLSLYSLKRYMQLELPMMTLVFLQQPGFLSGRTSTGS